MVIEIYHLLLNERAEANYEIEYGVIKIEKKGKRRREQISMAYGFHSRESTSREVLSVDISRLKPGSYEFFVRVKDLVAGQEKTRRSSFTVLE